MKPIRTCEGKASFPTIQGAKRVGEKFNQRAYQCPICFTYHLTKHERWRSEFVRVEVADRLGKTIQEKDLKLSEYKKEISRLNQLNQSLIARNQNQKAKLAELTNVLARIKEGKNDTQE